MSELEPSSHEFSVDNVIGPEMDPSYQGSELISMLETQKKTDQAVTALFSDIDDSAYLPDELVAVRELFRDAKEQNVPVVAVTGNQIQVVQDRIREGDLPLFQSICSSVGSQIWVLKPGANAENPEYLLDDRYCQRVMAEGFDRAVAVDSAEHEIDKFRSENPEAQLSFQWPEEEEAFLNGAPHLENQEFKVSLQFRGDITRMGEMKQRFEQLFPKFRVSVCQIGAENGCRTLYFIDILAADKADAIDYLCSEAQIDYGIVAGDSGNDIAMLTRTQDSVHSVLVWSHKPEALNEIGNRREHPGASGQLSFRRVPTETGSKLYYLENKELRGPDSIRRAATVLQRAAKIARIRQEREIDQKIKQ